MNPTEAPTNELNVVDDLYPSLECDKKSSNPLLKCVLLDLQRGQREGDQHKTAEAWNALGLIRLHTQRNAAEALRCHKQALTLCQDPVETAITLNDIALCYERLKRPDEALQAYQHALQILNDRLSDQHPRKLALMRSLARLNRT